MKLNTGKCYFLISGNRGEYMWAKLDQYVVWESNDAELLRVTIDDNLRLDKHGSNLCLKANRKLSALTRVVRFAPFKSKTYSF